MNSQIETWRVQAFSNNVYHISQAEGSVLEPLCRLESFAGKAEFFDRIGKATAQIKAGRNSDTPNLDIDHSRRMVTTVTHEWGTLVDRADKLENIHDPASEYAKAAANALGRQKDATLIAAALGYASAGEAGATSTALGNAQKVTAVKSAALDYANVQMLRKMKYLFDHQSVKGKRFLVHSADFLEALLSATEVTSSDFNTVRALVNGELNSFLGFEFKLCEEIDGVLASTYDTDTYGFNTTTGLYSGSGTALGGTEKCCLAFAEGALLRGEKSGSFIAKIEERADKGYSQQVYTAINIGGVRMEEVGVIQGIYKA